MTVPVGNVRAALPGRSPRARAGRTAGRPPRSGVRPSDVEQQAQLAVDGSDAFDPADVAQLRAACWRWRDRSRRRSPAAWPAAPRWRGPASRRAPAPCGGGSWRSRPPCAASGLVLRRLLLCGSSSCCAQLRPARRRAPWATCPARRCAPPRVSVASRVDWVIGTAAPRVRSSAR